MARANCGGLTLKDTSLVVEDGIITTYGSTPTGSIVANCGGVKFDSALFKKVNHCITDINAVSDDVKPVIVSLVGCGGLIVDSNYFEITDDGLQINDSPVRIVNTLQFVFIDQSDDEEIDLSDDWTLSTGEIELSDGENTFTVDFEDGVVNTDGSVSFGDVSEYLISDSVLTLTSVTATHETAGTMSAGASVEFDYDDMSSVYANGVIKLNVEATVTP